MSTGYSELIDEEIQHLLMGRGKHKSNFHQFINNSGLNRTNISDSTRHQILFLEPSLKFFVNRNSCFANTLKENLNQQVKIAHTFDDIKKLIVNTVISAPVELSANSFENDFFFFKVNHGFWERLCHVLSPETDDLLEHRELSISKTRISQRFFDTGFALALHALYEWHFSMMQSSIEFSNSIYSGFSLADGSELHQDCLISMSRRRRTYLYASNAIHGFNSWCLAMNNIDLPVSVCDGSFPKIKSMNNQLRSILLDAASVSDEILYLVPTTLKGIKLVGIDLPSEEILLSSREIHSCWAPTLSILMKYISERLILGKRILIFNQAASASALIALFIAKIKHNLFSDQGKILFFDLGQVYNASMEGEKIGPWANRNIEKGEKIFSFS
tara:strand:+ start:2770 stop:3930 length:1161 start_codon:yes stop_codon:yes gene_type:complete